MGLNVADVFVLQWEAKTRSRERNGDLGFGVELGNSSPLPTIVLLSISKKADYLRIE